MESTPKLLGFLLMLWITASAKAMPDPTSKNEISSSKNIVGVATQIITNALIQGQADSTTNYVFSPIGYATILSILGQGSVGPTRDEIFKVLEQPENSDEIRNAYREALTRYTGNDSMIAPQFKTWFYIYQGNTVEGNFKKILTDDYLVEVKEIERLDLDGDMLRTNDNSGFTNSKDIAQFEDLKNAEPIDEMGNIEGFDALKIADEEPSSSNVQLAISDYDEIDKNEKNKITKLDRQVDDSQYVEVPEIKKEIKDHETKLENETDGPEKVSLPIKKLDVDDSSEIMEMQENRNFESRFGRAQPLHLEGDVTSALSGNSVVGRKDDTESELESKMLLFNGLYFRGHWAEPFMELRSEEPHYFNALSGKQEVHFMITHGIFKYATIPAKNLKAVELLYQNERYSLLIVMPDSTKDLRQFSKDSHYNAVNEIVSLMEPTDLTLNVPKFRFECTSRAEKALGKLGLTTLFTSKADLRGVTKNAKNYQIEELVQHVAIRVDEASSTENALSAGNIHGRNNIKFTEIYIDKPFLFYVRDVVEDIILTAGKIVEIPVEQEIPVSFKNN